MVCAIGGYATRGSLFAFGVGPQSGAVPLSRRPGVYTSSPCSVWFIRARGRDTFDSVANSLPQCKLSRTPSQPSMKHRTVMTGTKPNGTALSPVTSGSKGTPRNHRRGVTPGCPDPKERLTFHHRSSRKALLCLGLAPALPPMLGQFCPPGLGGRGACQGKCRRGGSRFSLSVKYLYGQKCGHQHFRCRECVNCQPILVCYTTNRQEVTPWQTR